MRVLTLDFETFYSREFSLTKLTTEEYVRHPDFEVIGVSVQVDSDEPVWFSGTRKETKEFLESFDFGSNLALAHNAMFDAAILNWHFDIRPKGWLDTLSMARALHGTEVGGSLAVLAKHYGLGVKGDEVINAMGKRRADFNAQDLARYGDYCRNDVALTWLLFNAMSAEFPKVELRLIDLTIRMFSEPVLQLWQGLLLGYYKQVVKAKQDLLDTVTVDREQLMSNPKLATMLRDMGVEPPMKISPTTGKETYAFAKNDEEFKALLQHPDLKVQAIAAARLGIKSTLEETRTQRFIDIAGRGPMPVPLRYYAAHTGRWGGDDKLNLQNLPRKSGLKASIIPPSGYVILDSDSSQIEARTLAWLAEQEDLVQFFELNNQEIAEGVPKKDMQYDPYKIMAAAIYGKSVRDITEDERFVGKQTVLGCFGADTKVLTNSGWKRIVEVQATDLVWDGESWVTHMGVVPKGEREVIQSWGVYATPDHEILTEHGWREWREVTTNLSLSQSAFAKAHSLSLVGNSTSNLWADLQDGTPWFDVTADGKGKLTDITSSQGVQQGAMYALKVRQTQPAKSIGGMKRLFQTWSIGKDYSTALRVLFQDATQKLVKLTHTMAGEASLFMSPGALTAPTFYGTSPAYPTGMTPSATLTGLITTKGMSRTTFGSQPEVKTPVTSEQSKKCKQKLQTYDIAYAGPNNRFMIATDVGPLIVHNCGYGMGAKKFKAQLKTYNVDMDEAECQRIINVYRTTYPKIPEFWKRAQTILDSIIGDNADYFGRGNILCVEGKKGIRLPNGLHMKYPNLRKRADPESGKTEYVYDTKKGKTTVPNRIYGGKVVENVCQALARIVIGEQMLMVAKKYRVVMTVHDAIACIAPEDEAKRAQEYVELCMRMRPQWAPELPLNCESGYGKSYADC